MDINIGLSSEVRKSISEHLSRILANEYFLYLKTLNFHWNITGSNFISLHKLLENHYEWLKETVDEIAERIRTLGYMAPATYKEYIKENLVVKEGDEDQTAQAMLQELVETHESLIRSLRSTLATINGMEDYASEDMLIQWIKTHEKQAWMLRSHLLHKPEI